jgi:hypothetical protein
MLYEADRGSFWHEVEKLREKDKAYKRYAVPAQRAVRLGAFVTLLWMVVSEYLPSTLNSLLLSTSLGKWIMLAPLILAVIFWYFEMREARKYEPTEGEKLALIVSAILENLRSYSNNPLEIYANDAAEKIERLVDKLDSAGTLYERHFEKLKNYMQNNLILVLQKEDKDQLARSTDFLRGMNLLYFLCEYLMNQNAPLSDLVALEIPLTGTTPPVERTLPSQLAGFLRVNTPKRNLSVSVACGVIIGFFLFYVLGADMSASVGMASTVIFVVFSALSEVQRRRESQGSNPQNK